MSQIVLYKHVFRARVRVSIDLTRKLHRKHIHCKKVGIFYITHFETKT